MSTPTLDVPMGSGLVRVGSALPLDWRSGYEHVLVALDLLIRSGVDVIADLPGEGPDRERVLFTIHDLGLVDRVRLGGIAPSAQAAVRLVVPLRDDIVPPDPIPVGPPVVAADLPGLRRLLAGLDDVHFVPTRDPAAIAAAVVAIAGRGERGDRA